jgi:hypothetical protein
VDEDHTAIATVTATVSNRTAPVLDVPTFKSTPLGSTLDDAFYRDGVFANDREDGVLTGSVTYDASKVDTSADGTYKVTYSVTDSDDNTTTASTWVLVGWTSDGDYAVRASDFVTTAKSVKAATSLDNLILGRSHAEAYTVDKATGDMVAVTATVKDNGNLSATVGAYPNIQIGATSADPTLKGNPVVKVKGTVIEKEIINNTPEVDAGGEEVTPADGNDKNTDNPADKSRYLVAANNVTIRYSEVANYVGTGIVTKAHLIDVAKAEGFKIDITGTAAYDVDVAANPIPANATPGQSFYVTFIAKGVKSVWAKAKFTVISGDVPSLTIDAPLHLGKTDVSGTLGRADLMAGVTASDTEDGNLTNAVNVTDPATGSMPVIDRSIVGVRQVRYAVTDSDGNTVEALRSVIIDDGRYELVDEDKDGDIDYVIGARNFVVKQSQCTGSVFDVKARSYVEAYDVDGNVLTAQVNLSGAVVPQDYSNGKVGVYTFTWTLPGQPTVVKTIIGEVVPNDYTIAPDDKNSSYTVVANGFEVTTAVAATITGDLAYVRQADARVIKLVASAPDKAATLIDNGGFTVAEGIYKISFGASGIDSSKLSITIDGKVSDGPWPLLDSDRFIRIPVAPAGSPAIGRDRIITVGHVTAVDSKMVSASNPTGDITSSVLVTDTAIAQVPAFPADQPGVHQVKLEVVDVNGHHVERVLAVVVDDGSFVFDKDYILRAHDFSIDVNDVSTSKPLEQIREQAGVQAWRVDGAPVTAAVISTDGYRDAAGIYHPVVGIYDPNVGTAPVLIDPAVASKAITATVTDNNPRYVVTFDANGGTLVGPRTVTVTHPATKLPYLPASPIRDGHTFRYWSTSPSGGSQFAADTVLTGNITLYAQWTAIPVTPAPVPTPAPAPNITVNYPPSNGGGTVTYNYDNSTTTTTTAAEQPAPAVTPPAPEQPKPTTVVEPTPVPTVEAPEPATGWSLFNLLATIAALILLVVFFIKFFFSRPRQENFEEEPIDAQVWAAMTPTQRAELQARREAEYRAWLDAQYHSVSRPVTLHVNAPVLLVVGAAVVGALIVLFASQNFEQAMTAVDNYSVFFALIIFVQLLAPMVAAAVYNDRHRTRRSTVLAAQPEVRGNTPTA